MAETPAKTPVQDFFRIWIFFACVSLSPMLLLSFRALWSTYLCLVIPAVWLAIRGQLRAKTTDRWPLALAVFLGWFALTSLWSPSGRATGDMIEIILAAGLGVFVLCTRAPAAWMLVMGIFLALMVLTIDIMTGNLLRQWIPPDQPIGKDAVASARGLGLALIMLPPALLYLHRSGRGGGRWRGVVVLTGLVTSVSGILAYAAALLSALVGLVAGGLRPKVGLKIAVGAWAGAMLAPFGLMLALPPVAQLAQIQSLPDSILHRLIIWRSVLDLWLDGRIITGAGARATHTLTDRLGDLTLASGVSLPQVSAHPHNIPIQLLYEFGLIGYGLAAATLILGARSLLSLHLQRDMTASVSALLLGLAVLISVETDFWHLYFWSGLVISLLTFRAVAQDQPR